MTEPNTYCLYCHRRVNAGTEFCCHTCKAMFTIAAEYEFWGKKEANKHES